MLKLLTEDPWIDPFFATFKPISHNSNTSIAEKDGAWEIQLLVPGRFKADLDISVKNQQLTIACLKDTYCGKLRLPKLKEIYDLPDTADLEKITAMCENGVLTIHIPVREASKPVRIEIN